MIVRYILESEEITDERRHVAANVETFNSANIRLYESFKCRTKGPHFGKRFQEVAPTKTIKKHRKQWIAFAFPPSTKL